MAKAITCNETNGLFKILNFRLPNTFKKFGLVSAALVLTFLIAYKYIGSDTTIVKDVLKTLVLLFLLFASVSKEKFEDEYIRHIRFQSLLIAFVFTAAYYILIPLVAIFLDFVIVHFLSNGSVSFYEVSGFEILFTMLAMQLLSYEGLKRFGRV